MNRTLIWITPKWPLPADDGARQATTQLLKQLCSLGVVIDLCSIVPDNEAPDTAEAISKLGVRSVTLVKRAKGGAIAHLIHGLSRPWVPITISPYGSDRVRRGILETLRKCPESVIVYDGLHAAGWRASGRNMSVGAPSIYRAHNVERDLWIRGAKENRNPIFSLFLRFQAFLMDRFEAKISREAQVVFPVSQVDADIFSGWLGASAPRIVSLPIGIAPPMGSDIHAKPPGRGILFVGRLDWAPNRDGLRWFLENVWDEVVTRAPDIRLTIVGSGNGSWLEPYRSKKGVNFLGRVESLVPHYAAALASIVPVFFGSGTRVKAIEACLFGRVCIGTAVGVEGVGLTDGRDLYHVEKAQDWVETLVALDPDEALRRGRNAYDLVSKTFDPRRIAEKFVGTVLATMK